MPSPFIPKNSSVYHYRQRVPKDVVEAAKGHSVTIVVDTERHRLKVGSELKVSLQTKDPREAKERAKDVQGQFDMFWAKFRNNETELTFKQVVGLAGEVYERLVSFQDNPGSSPEFWEFMRVRLAAIKAMPKYRNPLTISERWVDPLEDYFGSYVTEVLDRYGLVIGKRKRRLLLDQVVKAYEEAVDLMDRRTQGDYRPDDNALRFPAFEPPVSPSKPTPSVSTSAVTFDEVIKLEEQHRKSGVGAKFKPMPDDTISKYTKAAADFAAFRGDRGELMTTITADELEGWIAALLGAGQLTARTIRGKASDIKTIVGWGVKRVRPNEVLRGVSAALDAVELPGFTKKPSDVTAIRPDEAVQVLAASRREADPRTRWLPWLSAYTGARINELAPLEREDFVEVEGYWFFKISQTAKRSVKTASSIRYVPLHPALVDEGLLSFVLSVKSGRLFGKDGEGVVQKWFRNPKGANIQREGVAPSHGWRHLFEDICIRDGVSDSAKRYVTGRAKGSSEEDYGKTLVRLPGLAREVSKIARFCVE